MCFCCEVVCWGDVVAVSVMAAAADWLCAQTVILVLVEPDAWLFVSGSALRSLISLAMCSARSDLCVLPSGR